MPASFKSNYKLVAVLLDNVLRRVVLQSNKEENATFISEALTSFKYFCCSKRDEGLLDNDASFRDKEEQKAAFISAK